MKKKIGSFDLLSFSGGSLETLIGALFEEFVDLRKHKHLSIDFDFSSGEDGCWNELVFYTYEKEEDE